MLNFDPNDRPRTVLSSYVRGGTDKFLARPTSQCRLTGSIVSLGRGVCSYAELQSLFFLRILVVPRTKAERKHVRRCVRFQQHRDASCHQVFFFLQGKAPKKIHAILKETLREHAPSYKTVKNWMAQFKPGDFSTCDAPRSGRPKS